ncbi:MAG: hypothetical protein IT426_06615 [Pirellulales bacterium]|nr:hypothetical protein [Pirellulales bacterium]
MRCGYRFGVLLVGLCFLGMSSCIDSENPLSDPEKAAPATELSGAWRVKQEDGTRYYHVGLAGEKFPAGLLRMKIIDHSKNGELAVDENTFFVFATAIGDRHFANVTLLEPDQLAEAAKTGWKPEMFKGYWIYEYKREGDKLRLSGMDGDEKRTLIESKKLAGVIGNDQVSFKESSEKLAKFVTSPEAAKLFQPRGDEILERIK